MPRGRMSMRKIKEILRLSLNCHRSNREIGRSIGVSCSTVSDCLKRARIANISWPLSEEYDDIALEQKLYSSPPGTRANDPKEEPQWAYIHQELKRKGVTLWLLWSEYKQQFPQGYGYSRFCQRYQTFREQLSVWMRQTYKAGERAFIDYAGMTAKVLWDMSTGECRQAQIFVMVLGASSYAYVEATWTQTLPDWIASHVRAFSFYAGVPELLVPDNLKSGVTIPHRYEPDVNPTYHEFASYYGTVVLPARVRAPRDKAKAEQLVKQVEEQLLAPSRDRIFLSLAELNAYLSENLAIMNAKPFQKLPGSRLTQFEQLDKPALKPLPSSPYEFAEWKKAKPGPDYHVAVEGHFYSVPYTLIKKTLDVRISASLIEIFYNSKRVASHRKSQQLGRHTTITEHMPKSHQAYAEWTPERLISWAAKTGPMTATLIQSIIASRRHPQQAYRSCLGILRFTKQYGSERVEKACTRAGEIGALSYKSIESILKNGLDKNPLPPTETKVPVTRKAHINVRGSHYFI